MSKMFVIDLYFRHNFKNVAQQGPEEDGPEIIEWWKLLWLES